MGESCSSLRITLTVSFFSLSIVSPPNVALSSFRAAMFFFLLSSERQMSNKSERKPLGSCPHIITTPFTPPPPSLVLYPPSFRLPEWQLAASRVHCACQPECRFLPTDLRKHSWTWLTNALQLGAISPFFSFFSSMAQTRAAHMTLPADHRALWSLKHATLRSHKAWTWLQWDGLEDAGHTGSCQKTNWVEEKHFNFSLIQFFGKM